MQIHQEWDMKHMLQHYNQLFKRWDMIFNFLMQIIQKKV